MMASGASSSSSWCPAVVACRTSGGNSASVSGQGGRGADGEDVCGDLDGREAVRREVASVKVSGSAMAGGSFGEVGNSGLKLRIEI